MGFQPSARSAIARLDEAKLNYQKQQYEHSLKVSDYQTSLQKQQEQINLLQTQLDKVDEELEQLTSVYSHDLEGFSEIFTT